MYVGQDLEDNSLVQSTGKGSQRVKGQEKRKKLDWYN